MRLLAALLLVATAACTTPGPGTCQPTTCNARCGFVDDGCNGMLNCGVCTMPPMDAGVTTDAGTQQDAGTEDAGMEVDGGLPDAGIEQDAGTDAGTTTPDAGLACTWGCPTGASCDTTTGTCLNAPNPIVINVKPWTVSGRVLARGMAPVTGPACSMGSNYDIATIRFTEVDRPMQLSKDVRLRCMDNFTFTTELVEGRYHVAIDVAGWTDRSNLPAQRGGRAGILDLRADEPNLIIDVDPQMVSGTLTLNGATPQTTSQCTSSTSKAVLYFEHEGGFTQQFDMRCTQAGWNYTVPLMRGKHRVRVVSYGGVTNMPYLTSGPVYAEQELDVTGPLTNQTLNVIGHTVSGRILLDGQPLTSTCTGIYTRISIQVWDEETILRIVDIPCSRPTNDFSMVVPPGRYWLRPDDLSNRTNLPDMPNLHAQWQPIDVRGDMTVDLDVQRIAATLQLRVDGATHTPPPGCTGTLSFRFTPLDDRGALQFVSMPCAQANWTMPATLIAGTYAVEVSVNASQLPQGYVGLSDRVTVSATNSTLVFDTGITQLSATVLLNGASPCTPGIVRVELESPTGTARSISAPCSGGLSSFTNIPVLAGRYGRIKVSTVGLSTSAVVERNVTLPSGPVTRAFDAIVPRRDFQFLRHGVTPMINPAYCNIPNLIHLSVRLREVTGRYEENDWFGSHIVCMDTGFVIRDVAVPEGVYVVEVDSDGQSNLPYAQWNAIARLAIP